jgi:hypothetical protein
MKTCSGEYLNMIRMKAILSELLQDITQEGTSINDLKVRKLRGLDVRSKKSTDVGEPASYRTSCWKSEKNTRECLRP